MDVKHSISFSAPIFQIKVAPYLSRLCLEIRHPDAREVEFAVVDMNDDRNFLTSPQEEWWLSLHAIREHVALLCRYEDPALPVHKGVEFRQLPDFSVLYSHPNAKVIANTPEGTVLELGPGELIRVDPNGIETNPLEGQEGELLAAMANPYWEASLAKILAPVQCPIELYENLPVFREHPPTLPQVQVVETEGRHFIAWHSGFSPGTYALHIACFLGELFVWKETVETQMQHLNPEPFFLAHDHIIWMEGRMTLAWRTI